MNVLQILAIPQTPSLMHWGNVKNVLFVQNQIHPKMIVNKFQTMTLASIQHPPILNFVVGITKHISMENVRSVLFVQLLVPIGYIVLMILTLKRACLLHVIGIMKSL